MVLIHSEFRGVKWRMLRGFAASGRQRRWEGLACQKFGVSFPKLQESERVVNYMAADEVLTVKDISDLLRVHPSTVYKLSREGKIPRFRVGNEWRFRKDVILRWIVEKSMYSSQIRKVAHSGRNGEPAGAGGRKN